MLEEQYCFDAEVYADEIELEDKIEFREDQRSMAPFVLRTIRQVLTLCSKYRQVGITIFVQQPYRRRDQEGRGHQGDIA